MCLLAERGYFLHTEKGQMSKNTSHAMFGCLTFQIKYSPLIIWISLWYSAQRNVTLQLLSVFVHVQGLPTTTVSPRYGLHCPLRTTTTPYPTSLQTAWTETPWEEAVTPSTPQLQALETGRPHQSRSNYKTAGFSTVTSLWRPGQRKSVPFFYFSVPLQLFTWR